MPNAIRAVLLPLALAACAPSAPADSAPKDTSAPDTAATDTADTVTTVTDTDTSEPDTWTPGPCPVEAAWLTQTGAIWTLEPDDAGPSTWAWTALGETTYGDAPAWQVGYSHVDGSVGGADATYTLVCGDNGSVGLAHVDRTVSARGAGTFRTDVEVTPPAWLFPWTGGEQRVEVEGERWSNSYPDDPVDQILRPEIGWTGPTAITTPAGTFEAYTLTGTGDLGLEEPLSLAADGAGVVQQADQGLLTYTP